MRFILVGDAIHKILRMMIFRFPYQSFRKKVIKDGFCAEGSQSVIEKGDKRNISRIFPEYFSDIVAICLNSSMHLQGKQGQKQSFFKAEK